MATFCTNCGKELADGTKFCTSCGAIVSQATPVQPEVAVEPAPVAAPVQPKPVPEAAPYVAPAATYVQPEVAVEPAPVAAPVQPKPAPAAVQYAAPAAAPVQPQPRPAQPAYNPPPVYSSSSQAGELNSDGKPAKGSKYAVMSTSAYFWSVVLLCIPIIGLIVAIIWACGGAKKVNRRNLAKCYFVFLIVSLVITILCVIGLVIFLNSIGSSLNLAQLLEYIQGGDITGLLEQFQGVGGI